MIHIYSNKEDFIINIRGETHSTIGCNIWNLEHDSYNYTSTIESLNNCVWACMVSYLVVDHVRPLLPHGLDGLEEVHLSLHLDPLHLTHCSNEHTSARHAITNNIKDTRESA